jgi:hypothetical protein
MTIILAIVLSTGSLLDIIQSKINRAQSAASLLGLPVLQNKLDVEGLYTAA